MKSKIRLGILFGGRSCEHEVSVTSARSVLAAVDKNKYDVTMIGISKQGRWCLAQDAKPLLDAGEISANNELPQVLLDYPGQQELILSPNSPTSESDQNSLLDSSTFSLQLDVVFPLLHGPYGEDGTVQGLLELADIAYVGSGVPGSAVGMDKELAKKVFRAEGLPQTPYRVIRRKRWRDEADNVIAELENEFEYPVFVKPVNLGSSVGITKAHDREELYESMNFAAQFDLKIIIEAAVENSREVECAVLGNEHPNASVVGEIIPGNEFYDYQTKYIDDNSRLIIPADISDAQSREIQALSIKAFKAVEAVGLSRVDFFIHKTTGQVYLNEINTMPGFTPISMYPKLWQASGIEYGDLIDQLIELALERHADKRDCRGEL